MKLKQRGFTLMELMVVVVIIGILAAVAYPSYTSYTTRTKRSIGKSELNSMASRQEQFYMDNKVYSDNLTELGMPANPYFADTNGNRTAAQTGDSVYQISVATPTTRTFLLTATPVGPQATQDAGCGNLTLDERGSKGVSGADGVNECW